MIPRKTIHLSVHSSIARDPSGKENK